MNTFEHIDFDGVIKTHADMPVGWLQRTFFSNIRICEAQKIAFDIVDNSGMPVLPHINPRHEGVLIEKDGFRTDTYEIPCRSAYQPIGRDDVVERMPGEEPLGDLSPEARLQLKVNQVENEIIARLDRSVEKDCASVLFNKYLDVKGPGVDERITYADANAYYTQTLHSWGQAGSDVLGDIEAVSASVVADSGLQPDIIVMNTTTWSKMRKDEEFLKLLDNRRVEVGEIKPRNLEKGIGYKGNINGIDIYTCDEQWTEGKGADRVSHKMVPDNMVLVASTEALSKLVYGIAHVTNPGNNLDEYKAVRYLPNVKVKDGAGTVVEVAQSPLPILQQPGAVHVLNVVQA